LVPIPPKTGFTRGGGGQNPGSARDRVVGLAGYQPCRTRVRAVVSRGQNAGRKRVSWWRRGDSNPRPPGCKSESAFLRPFALFDTCGSELVPVRALGVRTYKCVVSCLRLFGCEWCQIGANPVGCNPRIRGLSGAPPARVVPSNSASERRRPGSDANSCSVSRGGSEQFIYGEHVFERNRT
jgi:hypothetical protein